MLKIAGRFLAGPADRCGCFSRLNAGNPAVPGRGLREVSACPGPANLPSEVVVLIRVRFLLSRGGVPVDFRRQLAGVAAGVGHPLVELRVVEQVTAVDARLRR